MRKFYELSTLITEKDVYILEYKAPEAYDEYGNGEPIFPGSPPIQLFQKYKTHRKTDYLAGIFPFSIISTRFKQSLIDSAVTHIEFHPVQLICQKTKAVDNSYSLLNILDNVSCFDRERSEFEPGRFRKDVVTKVEKLVVLEDKIVDRDLVQMEEISSLILISTRLRTIIESAGITGVQFLMLEDFWMA